MRKFELHSIVIAAAALAVMAFATSSADAQSREAQATRAGSVLTVSPRIANSIAQLGVTNAPNFTSMAADYGQAYWGAGYGSGRKCQPGQPINMADGLRHACQ